MVAKVNIIIEVSMKAIIFILHFNFANAHVANIKTNELISSVAIHSPIIFLKSISFRFCISESVSDDLPMYGSNKFKYDIGIKANEPGMSYEAKTKLYPM